MDVNLDQILVLLALAFPFIGTGLVPLFARAGKSVRSAFAVIIGFCTAGTVLLLLPKVWFGTTKALSYSFDWAPSMSPFQNPTTGISSGLVFSVYIDPLSIMMAAIAGGIGSLVLLYSVKYMDGEKGLTRYYALVLLFIGAMIGLVFVDNLLVLYFFWEIVGLCSYALIGFYTKDPKAAKAGIKALVTTRVGDILLLIGIFVLASGAMTALGVDFWKSLSIQYLIQHIAAIPTTTVAIAGFCFIGGAIGKSAQIPLHVWLPDAMEAPTTISALIHAATMVNAGIYLMARSLPLFSSVVGWTTTLMWIGGITAFLAATMALVEPDLKRVLAYSTVSQLGYMMFGLGLGTTGFTPATYHLLVHAVGKALLFLGAGAVIHSVSTRNMYQMGGLRKEMKLTYITMVIGALSIAGLIPLSGFWSKDMILGAAWPIENHIPFLLMIFTGVLTAAYMIRMLNLVFWGQSRRQTHAHEAPWQMTVPLVVLALGTLIAWLGIGFLTRSYAAFTASFTFTVVPMSLLGFIKETLLTLWWVAGLSLLAFLIGIGLFYLRKSYAKNKVGATTITIAQKGYGFDIFYGWIIQCLRGFAARFRKTHTGDLNYNIAGIILGFLLLIVFIFFLRGF